MTDTPALFTCAGRQLRLTPAGCARLYNSTLLDPPQPWEGRAACIGCTMGARNAGGHVNAAELAAKAWTGCCQRCQIRDSRIINGRLCASCYNRDLEAKKGADRKGHRPILCDALHSIVVVQTQGDAATTITAERVLSAAEVLIAAAKTAKVPLAFGWSPVVAL